MRWQILNFIKKISLQNHNPKISHVTYNTMKSKYYAKPSHFDNLAPIFAKFGRNFHYDINKSISSVNINVSTLVSQYNLLFYVEKST